MWNERAQLRCTTRRAYISLPGRSGKSRLEGYANRLVYILLGKFLHVFGLPGGGEKNTKLKEEKQTSGIIKSAGEERINSGPVYL